mmetsp:Transcript_16046/g.28856  ORF Transcript_16046/g.28856 Transcript_16046/m.28856 type:complete len:288 (-) Transcript_16046:325-1188(-)
MKPPVFLYGRSVRVRPVQSWCIRSSWRSSVCSRLAVSLSSCSVSRWSMMPALTSFPKAMLSPGVTVEPIACESFVQCRPRIPGLQSAAITGTYVLSFSSASTVFLATFRWSSDPIVFISRFAFLYQSWTSVSISSASTSFVGPKTQASPRSWVSLPICHNVTYGSKSAASTANPGNSVWIQPSHCSSSFNAAARCVREFNFSCNDTPNAAVSTISSTRTRALKSLTWSSKAESSVCKAAIAPLTPLSRMADSSSILDHAASSVSLRVLGQNWERKARSREGGRRGWR